MAVTALSTVTQATNHWFI